MHELPNVTRALRQRLVGPRFCEFCEQYVSISQIHAMMLDEGYGLALDHEYRCHCVDVCEECVEGDD